MFDLLVYLFEYHQAVEGSNSAINSESMSDELQDAGFTRDEINGAFGWLESLVGSEIADSPKFVVKGLRFFSDSEKELLSVDVRSFLFGLRDSGVLDAYSFELVVDRLLALEIPEVEVEHARWVTLMVLCNRSEYSEVIDWAESVMSGNSLKFH